ncbi:MAG TPA: VCBS repeat-containing protein [Puia sp.]|nr:VCBS repeat-containing protein [Puia sp.]
MLAVVSFLSCHRGDTVFESLTPHQTKIDFANRLEKRDLFSILYYLYYYNGGGVAIGDVNNDGLPDIYFTANSRGHNKLYINKGNFQFEDVTEKAGVAGSSDWCTGVTMADVNGDGLLDIYVCAVAKTHDLQGHNELFINNGNGTFTESSAQYGLDFSGFSTQAVFFDYDHDGDLDCFLLNQSHQPNSNIVDTSNRRKFDANSGERLFRNDRVNGQMKFTDVSAQAGIFQSSLGYGLGVAVADFNNDGWEDIYVGNDFHENDYYYLNNGNGTFTESGAKHFNHYSRFSMGNDAADFNNDGQLDLVTVDMLPPDEKTLKTYGSDEHYEIYNQKIIHNGYQNQYSRNCLQRNNGDGATFSDIGLMAGISATDWSWSPLMADFDNDGNKDLFISSGIVKRPVDLDYVRFISNAYNHKVLNNSDKMDDQALERMPDGASHPFLFRGDGVSNFTDVSDAWGTGDMRGYFNGAAYADLDNDGNLDLVVNCLNAQALILKNNAPKRNYLTIGFKGEGMNTKGIGAKAWLYTKRKMQFQQLMLTRGFMSSSEERMHFGMDSSSRADSLVIVWPDQRYQVLRDVAANRVLVVDQKVAKAGPYPIQGAATAVAKEAQVDLRIGWKHQEDPFNDFNYQYLIPHMESTRGPKIAVADVNKDGLEDFFVCGARGQAGSLFLQTKDGNFVRGDSAAFMNNVSSEGVDAVFFDANNDGYPDLYVVSGGNEYEDGSPALADHLYINDGKGHFTEIPGALPPILTNKSCVAVADVNKDGFMDIFVGGLANARKFGYPADSYLLLNDGKGHFQTAPQSVISLKAAGIVTSCGFADINKDGWMDLVIAGEWMPVKIFLNNKGNFAHDTIPGSSGLWQSLYITDVDGDGNPDLLAGNWGHNSKLYAGKDGPLNLYIKDFDMNGSTEQVMTYQINGEQYTFLPKDELERALPVLKKAYLTYGEVAGKTVQYMFYDLFKNYTQLQAGTLSSSVFFGDGKGGFRREDLAGDLQVTPIFAFQRADGSDRFFTGGNFFGVLPYEGRYDAAALQSWDGGRPGAGSGPTGGGGGSRPGATAESTVGANCRLMDFKGEVRDLKWLGTVKYGNVLIAARNNDSLLFYKYGR